MLNRVELEKLISERNPGVYSHLEMVKVIDSIEQAEESIRAEIDKYLISGEEPYMEVGDYSYISLRKDRKMNPIAALLTLSWLIKHPETAHEYLKKGHDRIDI